MNDALEKAGHVPHQVEPALLDRISNSIRPSLRPVHPLPPTWVLASGLVLICAALGLAGAARAGFYGIERMVLSERVLIFSTLGILAWIAAREFVSEWIPGSRRRFTPSMLLTILSAALLTVFAILFRDYHTNHFVSVGVVCLFTGLLHAIPAGLLGWLVLRKGLAVDSVSAGVVGGALAGLAGVAMLELHCPNFEALHVLFWHTAVVPASAALGGAVGLALRKRSRFSS